MINRTRCLFYEVNGVFFKDLTEAQKADLKSIMPHDWPDGGSGTFEDWLSNWMLENAEEIASILTTTPRSRRRKPRADKGVPRKKTKPNELAKTHPVPA